MTGNTDCAKAEAAVTKHAQWWALNYLLWQEMQCLRQSDFLNFFLNVSLIHKSGQKGKYSVGNFQKRN